jgi:hypothetical protein
MALAHEIFDLIARQKQITTHRIGFLNEHQQFWQTDFKQKLDFDLKACIALDDDLRNS